MNESFLMPGIAVIETLQLTTQNRDLQLQENANHHFVASQTVTVLVFLS